MIHTGLLYFTFLTVFENHPKCIISINIFGPFFGKSKIQLGTRDQNIVIFGVKIRMVFLVVIFKHCESYFLCWKK